MKSRIARALAILEVVNTGEPAVLSPTAVRQLIDGFDALVKVAARHDSQFAAMYADIRTASLMQRLTRKRRQA